MTFRRLLIAGLCAGLLLGGQIRASELEELQAALIRQQEEVRAEAARQAAEEVARQAALAVPKTYAERLQLLRKQAGEAVTAAGEAITTGAAAARQRALELAKAARERASAALTAAGERIGKVSAAISSGAKAAAGWGATGLSQMYQDIVSLPGGIQAAAKNLYNGIKAIDIATLKALPANVALTLKSIPTDPALYSKWVQDNPGKVLEGLLALAFIGAASYAIYRYASIPAQFKNKYDFENLPPAAQTALKENASGKRVALATITPAINGGALQELKEKGIVAANAASITFKVSLSMENLASGSTRYATRLQALDANGLTIGAAQLIHDAPYYTLSDNTLRKIRNDAQRKLRTYMRALESGKTGDALKTTGNAKVADGIVTDFGRLDNIVYQIDLSSNVGKANATIVRLSPIDDLNKRKLFEGSNEFQNQPLTAIPFEYVGLKPLDQKRLDDTVMKSDEKDAPRTVTSEGQDFPQFTVTRGRISGKTITVKYDNESRPVRILDYKNLQQRSAEKQRKMEIERREMEQKMMAATRERIAESRAQQPRKTWAEYFRGQPKVVPISEPQLEEMEIEETAGQ